jgi:hypothetical protein
MSVSFYTNIRCHIPKDSTHDSRLGENLSSNVEIGTFFFSSRPCLSYTFSLSLCHNFLLIYFYMFICLYFRIYLFLYLFICAFICFCIYSFTSEFIYFYSYFFYNSTYWTVPNFALTITRKTCMIGFYYGWVHPVAHVTMNEYNNTSFATMFWYTCLIKHAETLFRTKDCCTHSLCIIGLVKNIWNNKFLMLTGVQDTIIEH